MKIVVTIEMMPKPTTKYVADDGREFDTKHQCEQYETTTLIPRKIIQNMPQWELDIPFVGWDIEPNVTKMFVVRNKEEYDALESYYGGPCADDEWWGDEPKSYPAAYIIITRDGYSNGWEVDLEVVCQAQKFYKQLSDVYAETHIGK